MPSAIGVVTGPFSATLLRLIESSSSVGSDWLKRLNARTPASWRSHSMLRPAAWKIRTTASVTSGPIPSPGISVMTLDMCSRCSVARERCHAFGEERRHGLEHLLIRGPERSRPIAVDVDLAEHLAAFHDRHDDLGLGVEAA